MKASLVVSILALAACNESRPPEIHVTNVWAQPIDKSAKSVAVYMTISDKCSRPDALRSVIATLPQQASLHRSSVIDNALRMDPVNSVPVSCAGSTMLKPMSTHVMVTGIQTPVKIGDHIPLTLLFDQSGKVDVVAEVTSMAVLEDVHPMHMNMGPGSKKMDGMRMR